MVQMAELLNQFVSGGMTDIHVGDLFQSAMKEHGGISPPVKVNVHIAGLTFKIIR